MNSEDLLSSSSTVATPGYNRKPEWLRIQMSAGSSYADVQRALGSGKLNTICEEARCPNRHECWGTHKTASFMILGDTCTRRCRFCAVKTGLPSVMDREEPARVAEAARSMELKHVVVTMVTRDDLPDGGAFILAETVRELRKALPQATVEVLASDLMGIESSIRVLVESAPDILSHNLETVRRLTPHIRSRSSYKRSLQFLEICRTLAPKGLVKSSLMLGLGEEREEVLETMDDLRAIGVDMLNIGQYLQPSRLHAPVLKYWTPEEFASLREEGMQRGFRHVESGPLVRSSYHAGEQLDLVKNANKNHAPESDSEKVHEIRARIAQYQNRFAESMEG